MVLIMLVMLVCLNLLNSMLLVKTVLLCDHCCYLFCLTSGYLDLVQRLEFGVDHLQKYVEYQIE